MEMTSTSVQSVSCEQQSDAQSTGIALIECGGSGSKAGNKNQEMTGRAPMPMPVARLQIDMDKNEPTTADERVCIALSPENAEELVSNASRFGPHVQTAVNNLAPMLDPGELSAGARTTPGLTQLAFWFHLEAVLQALIRQIAQLKKDKRVKTIRPVIVTSNGGGSGSALSRLVPGFLGEPMFRNRLLCGLDPFLLEAPIVLTAYPFTYARHAATTRQEIKILANQYAWLREMDPLLYHSFVSYVLAVGYSNNSGTVLDSSELMVDVLATSLHHFIRNYAYFMSRWTDPVPNPQMDHYLGVDLPERMFPSVRDLRIKYYGKEDLS